MNAAKELFEEFNNLMRQAEYSGCTEEFTVMVANKLKETRNILTKGDQIWYVDVDTGEIEEGVVSSAYYKNGKLDSFSADFIESDDFDEFNGTAYGKSLFTTREAAELALSMG